MPADAILFYVFAAIAIAASVLVIAQRSPIYSVLLLILAFLQLAGLYILLDAPFVAVIQIIIYTGAIMVLFLFVVMLLNAPYEQPGDVSWLQSLGTGPRRYGILIGVVLAVELIWTVRRSMAALATQLGGRVETRLVQAPYEPQVSSVREIGKVLYTNYGFAFEVTSVLILVAMVGAVVLAKREI